VRAALISSCGLDHRDEERYVVCEHNDLTVLGKLGEACCESRTGLRVERRHGIIENERLGRIRQGRFCKKRSQGRRSSFPGAQDRVWVWRSNSALDR
jgi:hypothetical protein